MFEIQVWDSSLGFRFGILLRNQVRDTGLRFWFGIQVLYLGLEYRFGIRVWDSGLGFVLGVQV